MKRSQPVQICQYRYDALDRLIGHTLTDEPQLQRFYSKNRLATEIQDAVKHSIVQYGDVLLAQQRFENDAFNTSLLATDQQRSVTQTLNADRSIKPIAYSPYGHRIPANGMCSLLGFNGERPDPVSGHYLLGNGYRAFNPVLMRFNSPDSFSPFGKGGLNTYTYCLGDPINFSDESGHVRNRLPPFYKPFREPRHPLFYKPFENRLDYDIYEGHRLHAPRQRRLSEPGPQRILTEPDFVGYHGTDKATKSKLLRENVDPAKSLETGDEGFYITPRKGVAEYHSRHKAQTGFRSQAHIVEVHIKNFQGMTPGKDYDFRGWDNKIKTTKMEFIARNHIARSIVIREVTSIRQPRRVKPRSFEAPF